VTKKKDAAFIINIHIVISDTFKSRSHIIITASPNDKDSHARHQQ
jgi:hypothetical protein